MSAASKAGDKRRLKIRLVTSVFGAAFIDIFQRVALRSLIADGNLIDLARAHEVQYSIFTQTEDAAQLQQSEIFGRVCEFVDISFVNVTADEFRQDQSGHVVGWKRALEIARRNSEILIFIIPDNLFGMGTLMRWASRFQEGFGAVYTPSPYVTLETLLPELEARFPPGSPAIALDGAKVRELVAIHLNPIAAAMVRGAMRQTIHPEHEIRPVERRGFLIRAYTSQPLCIDPSKYDSIKQFSPEDHPETICIEPCTTASLEPLLKVWKLSFRPDRLDGLRITQLGDWWNTFGVFGCREESRNVYDFCISDDAGWPEARRRALVGSRLLYLQVRAAATYSQIWRCLKSNGHNLAADMLAIALFCADLRRKFCLRGGAIVLVPTDKAFEVCGDLCSTLIGRGNESELISWIKGHVILPANGLADDESKRTANGVPISRLPANVKVLSGPLSVGEFTLYFIDRILSPCPPEMSSGRVAGGWSQSDYYSPKTSEEKAFGVRDIVGLSATRWPRSAKQFVKAGIRWLLYAILVALHRSIVLIDSLIPMRRAKYASRRLADILEAEGISNLIKRLWLRLGPRINIISNTIKRRIRKIGKVLRGPSDESIALFQEIRLVRLLQAIAEVLDHYERSALPKGTTCASLCLVRAHLLRLASNEKDLKLLLEQAVTHILNKNPNWAECWAEREFLKCDEGKDDDALECFGRVKGGRRMSEMIPGIDDSLMWAHIEAASIMAKRGQIREALNVLKAVNALSGNSPLFARDDEAPILQEQGWSPKHTGVGDEIMLFKSGLYPVLFSERDASTLNFPHLANFRKVFAYNSLSGQP